jgi:hypothetical protein
MSIDNGAGANITRQPERDEGKPGPKTRQGGKGKSAAATKAPAIKVIKKKKIDTPTPAVLEAEIAKAEKKLNELSEQMSLPEIARDATELIKLDQDYRQTELGSQFSMVSGRKPPRVR